MQMPLLVLGVALSLFTAALVSPALPHGAAAVTSVRPEHDAAHGGVPASAPVPSATLIGRPAPAWSFERWIRTAPLPLEALRGRVVLVRWWTDGCHYCAATLPGLETLRMRYADRGLVVIGAYHPKPPRAVSDKKILAFAEKLGFAGSIAVDQEWSTLERYWLAENSDRGWTSVSFLIDRAGVIRWLHGGGEYHLSNDPRHAGCDLEYRGLEQAVRDALDEPAPASASR